MKKQDTSVYQLPEEDEAVSLEREDESLGRVMPRGYAPGIDTSSKFLLVLVAIFGVGVIFMGIWMFRARIVSPLAFQIPPEVQEALDAVANDEDTEALRTKDTDKDGLTDYDEIYLYGTSPYLDDTDSDGQTEGQEVAASTDPNCPTGEDCLGIQLVTTETEIADVIPELVNTELTIRDKTVGEFRQILLDQGYPAEELATISDDVLLFTLQVLYEEYGQEKIETETVDLESMRSFLVAAGASDNEVANLSDEELMRIIERFQ